MKSNLAAAIVGLFVSASAFAALPPAVSKAANQLKSDSVRVRVAPVKATGPCDSDYSAVIQVKMAGYDHLKNEVTYSWETVKTVGIDKDGRIMEVCAE